MQYHHRYFLFAVVYVSYLCRDSTSLKPNISSITDQIIIKEGEPLRLHCSGNSDIFFTYPTNQTYFSYAVLYYTSPIEINKTQDEYGIYWYDFRRPSTFYGDTGWYGCSYQPILTTRHNYYGPEISSVYVYVESEPVRFVKQANFDLITAYLDETIVIPCRPTSPRAEVRIRKFHRDEDGKDEVVPRYSFDPRIGFTVYTSDFETFGDYKCIMSPDQEVFYMVQFQELAGNILPDPTIVNNTLLHVIKGETLYLKCTITIPKDQDYYDASWIPKQISDRITVWNDSRIIENYMIEKMALLKVTNVTYMDEGIYKCRVDKFMYEKISQTYIQVHEPIDAFISLTTQDLNTYYKRHIGDEVEWIVDVDAYPLPELKWINTHGEEITKLLKPGKSKFSIDNACCKPVLKINSLDLSDTGIYTIEARNQYKIEALKFTLDVIAGPKVYMSKPSSYYFPNQVIKVECHVEAFPKPNITWSYRKCPNFPRCEDGILEYLTNSRENRTMTHLLSTVWMAIDMSGELTCSACNYIGCGNVTEITFVSEDVGEFGIILTKDPVVEGDNWELICAASMQNYSNIFDWRRESGPIIPSDRIFIDRGKTQFTYRSILKIHDVKIKDSQEYICTGKFTGNFTRSSEYYLEVKAARAPIITDTNLKNGETIIDLKTRGRKRVDFHCFMDGMPEPSISWFKDGTQLVISNKKYKFFNNSQELILEYPLEVDSGEYVCRAENRIGKVEASQRIMIKGSGTVSNRSIGLIILVVILAVVVLILVIYVAIRIRHDVIMRKELMEAGLTHFEKGAVESLNPDLTVDDQADLLPYDKKWEFPREKLKLGKHLGSGAFGVVLKAEALGICEGEAVTTVAVKMVRRVPNLMYISALASELKIMVHLGKHLNIVNLLGACTKNILKRELLVIVEFCRYGNLHHYLLRNRSCFINQIDPETGKLDLSIGVNLLTSHSTLHSCNRIKTESESNSVQCHAAATDLQAASMGINDPVLNNDSNQPECSNYQGDCKDSNLNTICTQDLLSWAFQVARGMEYLGQRRILHGDLAARNILLSDNNVVKICDFGLAKCMYKEEMYKKNSDCPLPIKWLAIETMKDRIFSTQSDIWTFGIVLWEFFMLAETPYPGMEAGIVYQKLIEGYRLEKPEYATLEVYDIMCQCWKAKPSLRPSFTELVDSIGKLLEDNVKAHYIELNAPYQDMNRTLLESTMNDYLMMVSAPDHAVLSSPTHNCKDSSISRTTVNSGYLCMVTKGAANTSSMLNKEAEDPYLKPINVHERRMKFAKNREMMKTRVVYPGRTYANCNWPNKLELTDLNKNSDEVAEMSSQGGLRFNDCKHSRELHEYE